MDTRHAPPLVDLMRSLPAGGPGRDLGLQRLIDTYAADDAASALQRAADAVRGQTGAVAEAVSAAAVSGADSIERLRNALTSPAFLTVLPGWVRELREIAVTHAGTGACTVATALQLWTWTIKYFAAASGNHATAIAELADACRPLLAARFRILEIARGNGVSAAGGIDFAADVCHVHAAHAAAAAGTVCAELVFGYRRHLAWDAEGCATCYGGDELDELEGVIPGIASEARAHADVVEADGSHAAKAGPCARFDGVETFTRLRARLDGCLTGARLAKDRAAARLPVVFA